MPKIVTALAVYGFVFLSLAPESWAGSLTPQERVRFRSAIRRVNANFPRINDAGLDEMAELNHGIEIDRNLAGFLLAFRGTEAELRSYLGQLQSDRRRLASPEGGSQIIREWLSHPSLAAVERTYRRLLEDGWRIQLVNEHLVSNGRQVTGLLRNKEIFVSLVLSDEPPILVLCEEIIHALDRDIYLRNKAAIDDWLRQVIAENNTPGIDRISQAERYHWSYLNALSQRARLEVTQAEVDVAVAFLIEQSAYFRKLSIQNELRDRGLGFQNAMWDIVNTSRDPRKTLNLVLASTRFSDLPQGLATRIGTTTVEDIAVSRGGHGSAPLPGLSLVSQEDVRLPWNRLEDFLVIVPKVLKERPVDRSMVWNDNVMRALASLLSSDEAQALGEYVINPHLNPLPYRATEILRRRFGDRPDVDVYNHVLAVLSLLGHYDAQHGTSFTETYTFKMIEGLHRDRGMHDHADIFSRVATIVLQGYRTPRRAQLYLRAIANSRSAGGFLFNPNINFYLDQILEIAAKGFGPGQSPVINLQLVDALVSASVTHFSSGAQVNRTGSSLMDRMTAGNFISSGLKFFTAVGAEEFVQKYAREKERSQREIDATLAEDGQNFALRSPTPSGFSENQIPESAARLLIIAHETREQLAMIPSSEHESRRQRIWRAVTEFCENRLRIR